MFCGQPLGQGWMDVAKCLNESDWNEFLGHSIWRFRSPVYADAGASTLKLKKHG